MKKSKSPILDSLVAPSEKIVRGIKGQFAKGHSGNPKGMPANTPSLVRLLKKRLSDHPEDADKIIDALIKMGKTGDMRAIEQLLDRIDGKVIEKHLIEGEHPVYIQFVPASRFISVEKPEQLEEGKEE